MVYRITLFCLFTALAAPLEFHYAWWMRWVNGEGKVSLAAAFAAPLVAGSLFFYTVILASECLMTLASHDIERRPTVRTVQVGCFILFALPFWAFLSVSGRPLAGSWLTAQWALAAIAFGASVCVHLYVERFGRFLAEG